MNHSIVGYVVQDIYLATCQKSPSRVWRIRTDGKDRRCGEGETIRENTCPPATVGFNLDHNDVLTHDTVD